MIRLKKNYIKE